MLSARLEACVAYLQGFKTLYDVGTDHAYLPIEAFKRGLIERAYAIDNKKGPLAVAAKNIAAEALTNRITPKLADGLSALTDDVDVVVVAGLGGTKIYTMFVDADLRQAKRFILQANNHAEKLRALVAFGLKIIDEAIIVEDEVFYILVVLERGVSALTEQERLFGPVLLKKKPVSYKIMLEQEQQYLENLIATIPHETARKNPMKRLQAIKEVLYEW